MVASVWHSYLAFKRWLLYGDVYQFTSGPIIVLGIWQLVLKHNCYEHACKRIARVKGDDGHVRCKRCHRRLHPEYAVTTGHHHLRWRRLRRDGSSGVD